MPRMYSAVCALLVAGLALGRTGAADEPSFECGLLLFKTPNSEAQIEASQIRFAGGSFVALGTFSVRWGDSTFASDGPTLRWNGLEMPVAGDAKVNPPGGEVKWLSSPRITMRMGGGGGQVKTGMDAPLQYLDREADGRFALRLTPVLPEFDLKLVLDKGSASDGVKVAWRYRLVQGGKRKAIPGVSLDVGAPEMHDVSGQGTDEIKLGTWCLIATTKRESPSGMAMFLRIQRAR